LPSFSSLCFLSHDQPHKDPSVPEDKQDRYENNTGRTEQKHVRAGQSLQHIVIGYITCLTIFEILGEAGQKSVGMEILGR